MSQSSTRPDTRRAKGTGATYIYSQLRNDILRLTLPPGEDLDEASLVQRFGMSRTPVREALIRLAADGLVVLLPNRSAMVSPVELGEFPRFAESLDVIQRTVTRLAAQRRDHADAAAIREARDAAEEAARHADPLRMTERNRDFHLRIGEACGNRFLHHCYGRLLDHGMRMLRIPPAYDAADTEPRARHAQRVIEEHRAITEAVLAGDAERAESLARRHTDLFRARFTDYLQSDLATAVDPGGTDPHA